MRTPAAVLATLLFTGLPGLTACSVLAGGSGEFTVEGTTYKASRITCTRGEGDLLLSATGGPSGIAVLLSDEAAPQVKEVRMGALGAPPMLGMDADHGHATAIRTDDRFEVSGAVEHTAESRNAPSGTEEQFEATIECGRFVDQK